jgi:hypothetical protein
MAQTPQADCDPDHPVLQPLDAIPIAPLGLLRPAVVARRAQRRGFIAGRLCTGGCSLSRWLNPVIKAQRILEEAGFGGS